MSTLVTRYLYAALAEHFEHMHLGSLAARFTHYELADDIGEAGFSSFDLFVQGALICLLPLGLAE